MPIVLLKYLQSLLEQVDLFLLFINSIGHDAHNVVKGQLGALPARDESLEFVSYDFHFLSSRPTPDPFGTGAGHYLKGISSSSKMLSAGSVVCAAVWPDPPPKKRTLLARTSSDATHSRLSLRW